MSGRGRGNVTVKRGMPNLALAGKREVVGDDKSKAKTSRGAPRAGRGGTRGGRGGGKFNKAEHLIQTGGIFSEGLHYEPVKKKDNDDINFAKNSRNGIERRDCVEKMETNVEKEKNSFGGWDAEWQSDSEEDKEALKELLLGDNFISDYKKGDRLPIVLPEKDEQQYGKLMAKGAKPEEDQNSEKEKGLLEHEIKPTDYLSRKAGTILGRLFEDTSDESLLMLQVPNIVNTLTGSTNSLQVPSAVENSQSDIAIPQLPRGAKIGKIQITKKGRALLRIGNTVMDITSAAPTDLRENAVLLETKPEPSTSYQGFDSKDTGNAVYHLGEIKHNFVASLNWNNLTPQKIKAEPPTKRIWKEPDLTIAQELRALEEEAAEWAVDAERWATP